MKYSFAEDVLVGQSGEEKANYDLITVVMLCLGGPEYDNYNGIIKLLDVLLSGELESKEKKRILQEEFGIAMTRKIEGEVSGMCNLSEGIWEKAWDKAVIDTNLQSIRNLMESTGWSVEKCMDVLKVPEEEKEGYMEKLKEVELV